MDEALPVLNPVEVRVLGSLIEKQITTPDNYPLSLNALSNACNQLTNRDPVMSLDEQTIVRALDGLRDKRLAILFHGAESRVAKYRHAIVDVIPLTPAEVALLCVLMLRGPQTVGELRTRTERLFAFESLPEVETTLNEMSVRTPPLVVKLPRQPGTKESRYAHLLGGPIDLAAPERPVPVEPATAAVRAENDRVAALEQQLAEVRKQVSELTEQFAAFRRQFE
jgi:uncharacterized protein YceH (UPF0502 family)